MASTVSRVARDLHRQGWHAITVFPCSHKIVVARRLANAYLSVALGYSGFGWLHPTYSAATANGFGASASVTISFSNVLSTLVLNAAAHCQVELKVIATECANFTVVSTGGDTYFATVAVAPDLRSVVLSAALPAGQSIAATSFGWGTWPINTVVSAEGIPLQPWSMRRVTTPAGPTSYVSTSGTSFVVAGSPFTFVGTNCYYLMYSDSYTVNDVFQRAAANNFTVLRTWAFLDVGYNPGTSSYSANSVGEGVKNGFWFRAWDPTGRYVVTNTAALVQLDMVIATAKKWGIRLILTLTNNWSAFGGMDQVLAFYPKAE